MGRRMLEVPDDKWDPKVLTKLKKIAAYYEVNQKDVVWQAVLEFVERYPVDELSRIPNPFEGGDPDG